VTFWRSNDALRALEKGDARKAQILELRFFGGLTLEELAEVLGVAPITVSREWAKARAWLHGEAAGGAALERSTRLRPGGVRGSARTKDVECWGVGSWKL